MPLASVRRPWPAAALSAPNPCRPNTFTRCNRPGFHWAGRLGGLLAVTARSAGARSEAVRRPALPTRPPDGCQPAQAGLFLDDGARLTAHDAASANLPEPAGPVWW